jgi:hypothetical protein
MPTGAARSRMLAWFLLLPVCGAVFVASGCAASSSDADAHLVFCLGPAQRDDLASAAVSLGLAAPAGTPDQVIVDHRPTTLEQWERTDQTAFDRACDALATAKQAAPAESDNIFLTTLNGLIPLLVGAALGLLTSGYRDNVVRRRTQADELEFTTGQFVQIGDTFVQDWANPENGATPQPAPVRDIRWKLVIALRRVSVQHPRWADAVTAAEELALGTLGEPLLRGWERLDETKRRERATSIEPEWQNLTGATREIAVALRKPGWSRHVPSAVRP